MKEPPVAAEVREVREVSLLGTAEPESWRALLGPERLAPALRDGRAQLLIVAAAARFKGIPFRELSVSVLVEPAGAFLVQAFNSVRFFAWVERTFFSTPYAHGRVEVDPQEARLDGLFRAARRASTSPPAPETWEGPLYLPGASKFFHARLSGSTWRGPFAEGVDILEIRSGLPILDRLLESGFRGAEWTLRTDATHRKSKTLPRP